MFVALLKAYVMDWGTMMNLDGVDLLRRMLDLRMPWQNVETLQNAIYGNIEQQGPGEFVAVQWPT